MPESPRPPLAVPTQRSAFALGTQVEFYDTATGRFRVTVTSGAHKDVSLLAKGANLTKA